MTSQTLTTRVWASLLLLAFIWGGSFLSIRVALNEIGPLTSVVHRTGWATLALWIYVAARRHTVPKSPRVWAAFFVMGLLNNVLPFSLMAWGQLHIETGLTAILNASTAIFGVLIAALFFTDEFLSLRKFSGVCLGFFGVSTAIGLHKLAHFDLRSLAQLAVIAGTISYAFAGVWARKKLATLRPEVAAAGMLTASTLIMFPPAIALEGPITLDLSPPTWLAIAYYALIATALAYLLYYRILREAGSGNLMLVTLLIPPFAIVLGALALNETLEPRTYLGFGLLAVGLLIIDGRVMRRR